MLRNNSCFGPWFLFCQIFVFHKILLSDKSSTVFSTLPQAQDLQNAQLNGARTIVNILFRCHRQRLRGSFGTFHTNTLRQYYTTALGEMQEQNTALQTQVRWCIVVDRCLFLLEFLCFFWNVFFCLAIPPILNTHSSWHIVLVLLFDNPISNNRFSWHV